MRLSGSEGSTEAEVRNIIITKKKGAESRSDAPLGVPGPGTAGTGSLEGCSSAVITQGAGWRI